MPAFFVSYRLDDSAGYVDHLSERLRDCFGQDEVFRDYEAIKKGEDFDQAINDVIGSAVTVQRRMCARMIVIIFEKPQLPLQIDRIPE